MAVPDRVFADSSNHRSSPDDPVSFPPPSSTSRHRKKALIAGIFTAFLLTVPLWSAFYRSPVELNQLLISKLRITHGIASLEDVSDTVKALYSVGWQNLQGEKPKPDFEDRWGVFKYVFSCIPTYASVYPSEGFYYWTTTLDKIGNISGNIRVADLHKGKLSIAYFDVKDVDRQSRFLDITAADGLKIARVSDREFDVSFDGKLGEELGGKTVRFKAPNQKLVLPKTKLFPEERVFGRIQDESGVGLFLIFNEQTKSFYEVLDENTLTEALVKVDDRHSIGERTGFIFFQDPDYDRKLLVGVHLANVKLNNFLDGPGDQVPYWLNFKEELNVAYPNTMLGDGTDEHGVYLNKPEWVRIAVSPYHRYTSINDATAPRIECNSLQSKSEFWTCMTKEWWNTLSWRSMVVETLRREGKRIPPWVEEDIKRQTVAHTTVPTSAATQPVSKG